MMRRRVAGIALASLTVWMCGGVAAGADSATTTPAAAPPVATVEERVTVVGSPELAAHTPGSAHYLAKEELERQGYDDIHRVLQLVPGVNLQEEEGYGLRPNIGLRGTGVERSQKITLMEDGVLIAPAPYTAPAAYYFPTAGRMEGIEVRKGSAAIRQGPYTNGGALNLLSTRVPDRFGGAANASAGEDDTLKLHALVGNQGKRVGWLLETYRLETDGFKRLDGGGNTGVELEDYLGKLRWSVDEDGSHLFELKLGKTEQFGHETYLGLTEEDARAEPLRRYAASQLDTIDTDHEQVQLRYFGLPSDRLDISTTLYRNDFFRDWFKNESTRGTSNGAILADPIAFAEELAILTGMADSDAGDLTLRHNRRSYASRGVQTVVGAAVGRRHELELGLRWHEDEEDRFQNDELYQMLGGDLRLSEKRPPGSQTNRLAAAEAVALFLQDRVELGRFTVTPGLRYESIDYQRLDFGTADPGRLQGPTRVRENGIDVWVPGIGVGYELSESQRLFAGVHRGFSPPGAGVDDETKAEESLNLELGYRRLGRRLGAELTLFRSDYDNLLGLETLSGGGSAAGELFNGGEVDVRGLEAVFSYRLTAREARLSLPLRLTYTHTEAEFGSSFATGFADWAPFVTAGDELPYLPENQLTTTLGILGEQLGLHVVVNWRDAMRSRAGQGAIPRGEGADERWVVDVSGDWRLAPKLELYAQLRNAFDEHYIVARRPYGARPGLPRTVLAGVRWDF